MRKNCQNTIHTLEFLKTDDEYFDYYRKRHGKWKMYGLNLPDTVLKKLYYKNALKLFPNIPRNFFE
jgi:hypothetical protein